MTEEKKGEEKKQAKGSYKTRAVQYFNRCLLRWAERQRAARREPERQEAERLDAESNEWVKRLERALCRVAEHMEAERRKAEHPEAERQEAGEVEAEREVEQEADRHVAEQREVERREAEPIMCEGPEVKRLEANRLVPTREESKRWDAMETGTGTNHRSVSSCSSHLSFHCHPDTYWL